MKQVPLQRVCIIALLAAGCTAGAQSAEQESANQESAQQEAGTLDADAEPTSEDEEAASELSPFQEFLGGYNLDDEREQARFIADLTAYEERIQLCMRAEGFEYVVDPYIEFLNPQQWAPNGDQDLLEWTKSFGFGSSTLAFSQEEVGPDLIGYPSDRVPRLLDAEFPNLDLRDALDEPSRKAYDKARYGFTPEEGEELSSAAPTDGSEAGCEAKSREGFIDRPDLFFELEFGEEYEAMLEAIDGDSRVQVVWEEVGSCLAERGFNKFQSRSAIDKAIASLSAETEEIYLEVPFAELPIPEDEYSELSQAGEETPPLLPRTLTDNIRTRLAELQQREIDTAVAFHECGATAEGSDLDQVFKDVRSEYEALFLEENSATLGGS